METLWLGAALAEYIVYLLGAHTRRMMSVHRAARATLVVLVACNLPTACSIQPTAGRGFGNSLAKTSASPSRPSLGSSVREFEKWAEDSGIKKVEAVSLDEFEGERGVRATARIDAGARVLTVPTRLAIQVNSLSKAPRWCDDNVWRNSRWDARLAMLLLHERNDPKSKLKPWLAQLPRHFSTPVLWSQADAIFETLGYPALATAAAAQRAEWEKSRAGAPGAPSAEDWDWAMSVVRSRSFSGPYTPSTFVGSLTTLFGACTASLAYAAVIGGAGAAEQALNGFLLAVVFVVCNDFLFGPRLSAAKRHVLCPYIDMLNHDGTRGGSEIAYEYFGDAFGARLDPEAAPTAPDEQVLISYGDRSNDVLLQYYGFVEASNGHDVFATAQETLIVDVAQSIEGGLPAGALPALATAGLTDASAFHALTAEGASESARRLARLLVRPEDALASGEGTRPLPAAAEAEALRALASVAAARLEAMPKPAAVPAILPEGVPHDVLQTFVAEKRKLLEASESALRRQASAM